jgi:AraC-like DNA-binding protein
VQREKPPALHRRILQAFQASAQYFLSFDPRRQIAWGCETRRAASGYHWDGMNRGVPSGQPRLLFQYTLAGRGEYAERQKRWTLGPNDGFTVVIPSPHRYYLPADSGYWFFFWFIVQHPFVTKRIRQLRSKEDAVQNWPATSPALELAVMLFEAACLGQLRDVWKFEERLFAWLLETERELHHRRYPRDQRLKWLDQARRIVLEHLPNPPTVTQLADANRLERTTFSRKFKAGTGQSPASFVTEIRLEEALKLLRTEATLDEISSQTGFADANHFCKVFRRHFHSSPGAYRRLILKR